MTRLPSRKHQDEVPSNVPAPDRERDIPFTISLVV